MATTQTTTSNYSGKVAGAIIGQAFKENDVLRLGLVTVAENVNHKLNLRKIQTSNGTIDYTCGFPPAGSITLSEKVIEPKKLMVPIQICKEEFRQTWSEDLLGASAHNPNVPSDIMEAITMNVLAEQAEKVGEDMFSGADANSGEFQGLVTQWALDSAIIKDGNGITAPGAVTTESNVEAHLKLALAGVPTRIRRKDLVVAVSPDVFQAYWFYLVSKGIANDGNAEPKQTRFGRYTISEVQGMPDNTIAVWEKQNVVFATGLLGDHNELILKDEDEIGLLTGMVRGKMVYTAGIGYYNSNEIVYLDTTA